MTRNCWRCLSVPRAGIGSRKRTQRGERTRRSSSAAAADADTRSGTGYPSFSSRKLAGSVGRGLVARNAAALAGSRVLGGAAGFLLLALAGRRLSLGDFGLFYWLAAVTGVLVVASDFGLDQLLVKEASIEPGALRGLARRAVGLKLAISVTLGLASYAVLSSARSPASTEPVAVALMLGSLPLLGMAHTAWFCADPSERMHLRAAQAVAFEFLRFAAAAAVLVLGLGVLGLCGAWFGAAVVAAVIGAVVLKRLGLTLAPSMPEASLLKRVLPFACFQLESVGLINVPTAVLGWVKGKEQVGLFSYGALFLLGVWMLAAATSDALFPRLSRGQVRPVRIVLATLGFSVVLVGVLTPFRGTLVGVVFGEPRPVTEVVLLFLLPAGAFASVQPLASKALMASGRTMALAVFEGFVLLGLGLTCWAAARADGAVAVAKMVLIWRAVEAAGLIALIVGIASVRNMRNHIA